MAVEITVEGIPRGEIERAVARLFRKSTMNLYGRSVRARTRERMIEEVDPDGTPWAPLSEPYGSRKKGPGKLRETLALFKTMHVDAQKGAAQVGTRLDYGTWNQEGTESVGVTIGAFGAEASPRDLPARPWLGVTDQDITDIEVIANGIWESSF
jgi:phage gpG-like protein